MDAFQHCFLALKALASALASALGGVGAFFLASNAILVKQADIFFSFSRKVLHFKYVTVSPYLRLPVDA